MLQQVTNRVLVSAFEDAITEHFGYDKYDPPSREIGNMRNGIPATALLIGIGLLGWIDVPRDRNASLEPKIVAKLKK